MASDIKIAPGWNNAAALSHFDISPDTNGVEYPREIDAADGSGFFDGSPFAMLRFPDIMEPSLWVMTLGKAGLGDPRIRKVKVTVRLPNENKTTYANYNGWATRPRSTPFAYCWYQTPQILVTRLEAI